MDHPASYLAARLRARYEISFLATTPELLHVCERQGVAVVRSHELQAPGLFIPELRLILLHRHAPPWVLAHELAHFLLADEAEHGVVYHYHGGFYPDPLEQVCEEFASLMCGSGTFWSAAP